ncbi:MAG TPA: ribosome-associated translation inhibitor RaiA [Candidatus Saccharimonadales bacterium]|nr:ribosome-associated translation inhibitor RaiA [Candidatus Saccharimonadales bacterium]
MIQKLEISGVHTVLDDDVRKYVTKKIGKMDLYMSRHSKQSAHAEVKLKEAKIKERKQATCEVIMHLPHETFVTKETTLNMYAAIDIVEAKLKNQLKKYKETHESLRLHKRIIRRIKRSSS